MDPKIVGLLLRGHPSNGPRLFGNSRLSAGAFWSMHVEGFRKSGRTVQAPNSRALVTRTPTKMTPNSKKRHIYIRVQR